MPAEDDGAGTTTDVGSAGWQIGTTATLLKRTVSEEVAVELQNSPPAFVNPLSSPRQKEDGSRNIRASDLRTTA